jgi:hypothetical protein
VGLAGLAHAAAGPEFEHWLVPLGRLSAEPLAASADVEVHAEPRTQAGCVAWRAGMRSGAGAAARVTMLVWLVSAKNATAR